MVEGEEEGLKKAGSLKWRGNSLSYMGVIPIVRR